MSGIKTCLAVPVFPTCRGKQGLTCLNIGRWTKIVESFYMSPDEIMTVSASTKPGCKDVIKYFVIMCTAATGWKGQSEVPGSCNIKIQEIKRLKTI